MADAAHEFFRDCPVDGSALEQRVAAFVELQRNTAGALAALQGTTGLGTKKKNRQ